MSGQLRELKNRIRSVENTKKITRAMEMVAAAKLRRFQNLMSQARPYTDGLENLLKRLQGTLPPDQTHPFFEQREEKKIAVVLMTSDSGLCGTYNNNLIVRAEEFLHERQAEKTLIAVGKSGVSGLRRLGHPLAKEITEIRPVRFDAILQDLRQTLEGLYLGGHVDAVYVIYSHFVAGTQYYDTTVRLLPMEPPKIEGGKKSEPADYLFEPSAAVIFEKLIPAYFEAKNRQLFLESIVSEQVARMTAMHQATENAKEMIDALVLKRNKARQASITKEIIEIVSGSQALKLK